MTIKMKDYVEVNFGIYTQTQGKANTEFCNTCMSLLRLQSTAYQSHLHWLYIPGPVKATAQHIPMPNDTEQV